MCQRLKWVVFLLFFLKKLAVIWVTYTNWFYWTLSSNILKSIRLLSKHVHSHAHLLTVAHKCQKCYVICQNCIQVNTGFFTLSLAHLVCERKHQWPISPETSSTKYICSMEMYFQSTKQEKELGYCGKDSTLTRSTKLTDLKGPRVQ